MATLLVLAGSGCTAASEEADTRGYRLAPPRSVGEYKEYRRYGNIHVGTVDCAGEPTDADCYAAKTELRGIGIEPDDANRIVHEATGTGADYVTGGLDADGTRHLVFRGLQGQIPDPGEAVARMFRSIEKDERFPFSFDYTKWVGGPETFELENSADAVMRCRKRLHTFKDVYRNSVTRTPGVICVWADHSTVAATGLLNASPSRPAELTAELYRTSRVRM
ncbi:hypothetical protein NX801_22780 [Streptomyces sp. LP05-1]|uniref:Lipoprotein n=1 Tax=Streptomyces pyxinae TaxID=2970734 RepID=A0ABT2CLW8_9ACTN|nr:hypothetical protein [Streptomyces sp. LP05-1]MCS0638428.1 hypothetical protein [Streptomyces sp. LP05-1]